MTTRQAQRGEHLRSDGFLHAAKYPIIQPLRFKAPAASLQKV
ncbi:hypothetical protein [Paenibacillus polymyxa]